MKKINILLLLTLVLLYSFTTIDTLNIPSNIMYLDKIKLKLNKIPMEKIENKNNTKNLNKNFSKEVPLNLNINLTGIIKSQNRFYAIIDGDSYKVGDKIKGFIIKKIMINKIILESEKNEKKQISILLENNY